MSVNPLGTSISDPSSSAPPLPRTRNGVLTGDDDIDRSPLERARKWFASRVHRRLNAAGQRVEQQLRNLGPVWRVVEWPTDGQVGLLAIGPGGVYAVYVVDQGRQRVMVAGDVVQIHGRRPPYVTNARRAAKRASRALSAVVGTKVPVVPVLTFVGSGSISAHGLPNGCLVVPHRELDRLLVAGGEKISPETAWKLADVASHPATWADQYRWYPDSQTASDNRTAYR